MGNCSSKAGRRDQPKWHVFKVAPDYSIGQFILAIFMMHTELVENIGLCKFLWNQPAFHRSWANKRIVSADGGEPTSRYSVWDSSNLVGCKPGTYTIQFRHLTSHVLHKVKALRNYLLHKERFQQIFLISNCYVLAAEFCRFSRKWKSITNSCWRSQTEGRSPY